MRLGSGQEADHGGPVCQAKDSGLEAESLGRL